MATKAAVLLFLLASFAGWGQSPSGSPSGSASVTATAPAAAPTPLLVLIKAAGSSVSMGDGSYGPKVSQAISYDFQMAKYPVTNGEFAQFMMDKGYETRSYWTANGWAWKGSKTAPPYGKSSAFGGANQPVVGVSWYEAVAYCNWLSARESLAAAYDDAGRLDLSAAGYHLPTEVEWEYAAARGAPDQPERLFPWGNDPKAEYAVSNVPPGRAARTESVDSRSPQGDTPQGLADMSGNAWEWCSDNFQSDGDIAGGTDRYYFVNDSRAERFVLHGGSWVIAFLGGLRTRFRSFSSEPNALYNAVGFRVVKRSQ